MLWSEVGHALEWIIILNGVVYDLKIIKKVHLRKEETKVSKFEEWKERKVFDSKNTVNRLGQARSWLE